MRLLVQAQRQLLITTATSLAAFLGGYITAAQVAAISPQDMQILIRGSTVEVHAVDLREPTPGVYMMQVYGSARNSDGGAYDMGGVTCSLDDAGMGQVQTRMQSAAAQNCAAGDSGVDASVLDVHGVDFRRAVNPDGGVDLVNVRAYGNYDGGAGLPPIYLPGYACANAPAGALTLMNKLARACFMKMKGLAQ